MVRCRIIIISVLLMYRSVSAAIFREKQCEVSVQSSARTTAIRLVFCFLNKSCVKLQAVPDFKTELSLGRSSRKWIQSFFGVSDSCALLCSAGEAQDKPSFLVVLVNIFMVSFAQP